MRKIIDTLIIIVVWLSIAYLGSKVVNINWDFFIGGMFGYILAIFFYHDKNEIKQETQIKKDTESEIDDAPWYH